MKKAKYIAIGSVVLVLIGMLIAFNILNKKNERDRAISLTGPVVANQIADFKQVMKKLKVAQATIEEFKQSQELIVLETDLAQSITWDESWGSLSMFKKLQEINFYGKGFYTVDLEQIKNTDIDFKYNEKKIYITSPKPQIKSIELDESKTTYSLPEKGLFRFGDIKITPAQNQMVTQEVKSQMKEKMNSTEMYNKSITSADTNIKDLFKKIISSTDFKNYEIVVIWKSEEDKTN